MEIDTYLHHCLTKYLQGVRKELLFSCVPGMALILLVKVQSRVFTAKCSEPQAVRSNPMGEGRGVAKSLSLRTET